MNAAIKEWFAAYFRQEAGNKKDPCTRIAYTIVHKLDKGVFAEYKSDILDKEKTDKGAWMDANLSRLDLAKSDIMQWMLVGGEVYVKPDAQDWPGWETVFHPQPSGETGRSSWHGTATVGSRASARRKNPPAAGKLHAVGKAHRGCGRLSHH